MAKTNVSKLLLKEVNNDKRYWELDQINNSNASNKTNRPKIQEEQYKRVTKFKLKIKLN